MFVNFIQRINVISICPRRNIQKHTFPKLSLNFVQHSSHALALIGVTAQQNYFRHVGVRPPSVKLLSWKPAKELIPKLGERCMYLSTISPNHFLFLLFCFFTLRGGSNFSIPHTNKSYIKNSFWGLVLYDWNRIDLNIRESGSNKLFKTKLRQQLCKLSKLSNVYNKTSGQASVHHARMRMGLSALNAHRRKYNFINDNMCPLCNMRAESTHHYFLVCPALATPRTTLLSRLLQILRNLPNQYVLLSTRQSSSELHELLLNGSSLLPPDINLQLFDVVAQYIVSSNCSTYDLPVRCLFRRPYCWPSLHRPTTTICVLKR